MLKTLFPCSTSLIMKFIMLIIIKMESIVGILTCISMVHVSTLKQDMVHVSTPKQDISLFFGKLVCVNKRHFVLSYVEHEKNI